MLDKNGVASIEQIKSRFPSKELLLKPKAITECYEEIPCNPCSTSCPFDAIHIGEDINTPPVVDFDKCTGCGICVYSCPGLAIVTAQIDNDKARFKLPYEFRPLPFKDEIWDGVNRSGEVICKALILKVTYTARVDRTALVEVSVPLEFLHELVTIRRVL